MPSGGRQMENLVVDLGFTSFPYRNTCVGENLSPEIRVKGLSAKSIAVVAINPFEKCCSFASWLIWNIPPMETIPGGIPAEPEPVKPVRAKQGKNDYGLTGYSGPCAPPGASIRYLVKVYGLDGPLDLPAGSTKDELFKAMQGHVVQYGDTVAMFTSPE